MPREYSPDGAQVSEREVEPRWERLCNAERGAEPEELEPSLLVIRYNDPKAPETEITEDVFYDPQICRKDGQTRLLVTCEQVLQLNESAKSSRRKLEFCREHLKKCRKDYAREIQSLREQHAPGSSENERPFGSPKERKDTRDVNTILKNLLTTHSATVLIETITHLDPSAKIPCTNTLTEEDDRTVVGSHDSPQKKAIKLQQRIVELERRLEERSTEPKTAFSGSSPQADASPFKNTKAQTDCARWTNHTHVCADEKQKSILDKTASKPVADISKLATAVHANSEFSQRMTFPVPASHEQPSPSPTILTRSPSTCSQHASGADAKNSTKHVAVRTTLLDTVDAASALGCGPDAPHTAIIVEDVVEDKRVVHAGQAEAENAELWARIRDLEEQLKQQKNDLARPKKSESDRTLPSAEHIAYVHTDTTLEEKESLHEDSDDSNGEEDTNPWRTSLLTYRQRLELAISQSGGNLSRSDFLHKDQHMREQRSRVMGHKAKVKQEAELLQSLKVNRQKGNELESDSNVAQPLFGCPAVSRVQNDRKVNQALLQSSYKVRELDRQSNSLKADLAAIEDLTDTTTQQHKWLLDREIHVLDTTTLLAHREIAESIARYKCQLLRIHKLLDNARTSSYVDATEINLAHNELDAMGDLIEAALQRDTSMEGAQALDDFKQSRSGRALLQEQHANLVPKLHALRGQAETVKLQKDNLITRKKELEHEMARVALYMTRHISVATPSTAASSGTVSRQSRRFNTHSSAFSTSIPSPRSRSSLRLSTAEKTTDAVIRQHAPGLPRQPGRNLRVEWLEVPAETSVERGSGGTSKGKRRVMRWTTHSQHSDQHSDSGGDLSIDIQGRGTKAHHSGKPRFAPGSLKLDFGFRPDGEGEDSLETCALFKVTKSKSASALTHTQRFFTQSGREKRLSRRLSRLNVPEKNHFGTYAKYTM